MAVGMTCIPTIREEVVRLHQADVLHEAEEGLLARRANHRSAPQTIASHRPAARHPRWRAHRPMRLTHSH